MRATEVFVNGQLAGKEDLASFAGKSAENGGVDFKYDYDYEKLGRLIREFVPAWRVEIEKYFVQLVFNFLFSNGDAHLKNFHVSDATFGLNGGLMPLEKRSIGYRKTGHPGYHDFVDLAVAVGVATKRIDIILAPFIERQPLVEELISHSYLADSVKKGYLLHYSNRRNLLAKP